MADQTSRVSLAYIIKLASAIYSMHAYYMYSIHAACNTHAKTELYCAIEFVSMIKASKSVVFVYIKVKNRSLEFISVIEVWM